VIATLAASLIVAITLTPFVASKLLKEKTATTRPPVTFRLIGQFVEGPYRRALNWVSNHPKLTVSMAVLSLVGALSLFPLVDVRFVPKAAAPPLRIMISLP